MITNLFQVAQAIIEVDDLFHFKILRMKRFFCLDDESEIEQDSIFNHLLTQKDQFPLTTLLCLFLFASIFQNNNTIRNYIIMNNHVSYCLLYNIFRN